VTLLVIALYLLGGATLIAYPIGLLRGLPTTSTEALLAIVGLAYGALALWCGRLLWSLDRAATGVFIAWCLSLAVFNALVIIGSPEFISPWLIPPVVFAVAALAALYFYIRRQCGSAA
jgi:hypothetical protein